jgi:hypothetical protein
VDGGYVIAERASAGQYRRPAAKAIAIMNHSLLAYDVRVGSLGVPGDLANGLARAID